MRRILSWGCTIFLSVSLLVLLLIGYALTQSGGTQKGDTVEMLSATSGVRIGVYAGGVKLSSGADATAADTGFYKQAALAVMKKDAADYIVETNIYLYNVSDPYVYLVNKDSRYTVYDYRHAMLICQTYDLGTLDRLHRAAFGNIAAFHDLVYIYGERANEYPVVRFGDGVIYLQHNIRKDEYYLKSKIADGEKGDIGATEKMRKGVEVDYVRKYAVMGPLLYVVDCNGRKTVVNTTTYERVYSEYLDGGAEAVDLSPFENGMKPVEDAFYK